MQPAAALSDDEKALRKIAELAQARIGIQLGSKQMAMVRSRLVKRLLALNLADYNAYYRYFAKNFASEIQYITSLLTTHHTFFFREFAHFEYLLQGGLAQVVNGALQRGDKKITVWSAACSRGQEVYSLAMFLAKHLPSFAPLDFEILGTDVDLHCVTAARAGIYSWNQVKEIPQIYLTQNWQKGTGDIGQFAKIKDKLKRHCRFEVANLLQLAGRPVTAKFDIIFCRNVFIYFDALTVRDVTHALLDHLHPTGLLFVGLSETLSTIPVKASPCGLSVYTKAPTDEFKSANRHEAPTLSAVTVEPAPLRVLCVDDSTSILQIMKRMLTKDAGFEVVATASNGLEAKDILIKQAVDVVTLDIHMPVQDGISYLEQNFNEAHPPVVMVTAASRDDVDLARKAMQLGAIDFIEKPSIKNFDERRDEMRSKLKTAVMCGKRISSNGNN